MRLFLSALLLFGSMGSPVQGSGPRHLRLALASNLQPVFPALKAAFEKANKAWVLEASFGATGTLHTQILNGAPFDLFLSADEGTPKALAAAGRGLDEPFPYAKGVLVLWVPKDSPIPVSAGLKGLATPSLRLVALANPKVAPYGAAAEAALKEAGLLETLRPKFVVTENIAQAAQYAYTGVVDVAFLALSQVRSPALRGTGRHWEVPPTAHPPILQWGLILAGTADPVGAKAFRTFLLGGEGQAILRDSGYQSPR